MGKVKATPHAVYNINYHLVWIPKYRKSILRGEMKERLKEIFSEIKDIFYLRAKRKVDPYYKISAHNFEFRIHKAPLREEVRLRIVPNEETGMAEIRIWYKDILTDVYQVKNSDLDLVRF